ncbi:MAG: hypothetical protein EXQ69_08025 [Acidimicrobiia bacterium]|nr:hypothetical protein [Acidimicrobiia bacterium]
MSLSVTIPIAVIAALVFYLIGVKVVRVLMMPPPPDEPDLSLLRPVELRYQCMVCGAGVTMTATPGEEDPTPPRHCREDMVLADG